MKTPKKLNSITMDPNLKNAKILIVDDQEANIDVLRENLIMQGYTNIKTTTNSSEVLALKTSYDPDIILLDLLMPMVSGFEVLEQMRTLLLNHEYLPIIVLSASISPESKQKALALGAKDFVSKPFDLIEVNLRIKNLLETRFFYKYLISRNKLLEGKVIDFLKIADEWYR